MKEIEMKEIGKKIPILNASVVMSLCWQMTLLFTEMHSHMFDSDRFTKWMEIKREILINAGSKKEEVDIAINQLIDFLKLAKENDKKREMVNGCEIKEV